MLFLYYFIILFHYIVLVSLNVLFINLPLTRIFPTGEWQVIPPLAKNLLAPPTSNPSLVEFPHQAFIAKGSFCPLNKILML